MEQAPEINAPTLSVRNTFLTVLCILTFIGSGYGLYKAVTGYFTADATASVMSEAKSKVDDQMEGKEQPAFVKGMMNNVFSAMSADNIRKSSIISLLGNILTLIGAILMWGLRKAGYYSYIAGTVVLIVGPLILFGGGLVGLMGSGFTAIIGIAFIVMYGVNSKYMTR